MKKLVLFALVLAALVYADVVPLPAWVSSAQPMESNGLPFTAVAMPDGAKRDEVLIFTVLNCTKKEARLAERLEREITAAGVPARRSSSLTLSVNQGSAQERAAAEATGRLITSSKSPLVFVNGYGKSQPTTQEVLAMVEKTSGRPKPG